jgi:heme exporter protein C
VPSRPPYLRQLGADYALGTLTLLLFGFGATWALHIAPPDRMMGDVYRILFVHVPSAWLSLVAYTVTVLASALFLWRGHFFWDAVAEASAELGVLFNVLLLITGAIWGKPTWGVWWTWDPRLTTAAIMCFAFFGLLALRELVTDVHRRATWSAVTAVLIYADIPLVWFSVRWWNTLHQLQSSPETMAAPMVVALRLNAFAFLALYLWMMRHRVPLASMRHRRQLEEPPMPAARNVP